MPCHRGGLVQSSGPPSGVHPEVSAVWLLDFLQPQQRKEADQGPAAAILEGQRRLNCGADTRGKGEKDPHFSLLLLAILVPGLEADGQEAEKRILGAQGPRIQTESEERGGEGEGRQERGTSSPGMGTKVVGYDHTRD